MRQRKMGGARVQNINNLTLADARRIRVLHRNGRSINALRRDYAVANDTMRDIVFGRRLPEPTPVSQSGTMPAVEAIALYRNEKARRLERLRNAPPREAKMDFHEKPAGRPGKIFVGRTDPADALVTALSEWKNPRWS